MKKTAFKILLLICLSLILDQGIGSWIGALHRKDPRNSLWRAIENKSRIVFLGSSRDKHGIIPKIIEEKTGLSAYNGAFDGAGMVYIRGAEAFLVSHYQPEWLVISVIHLDQERGDIRKLAPYLPEPAVQKLLAGYPWQVRLKYGWFKTPRYNSMFLKWVKRRFEGPDSRAGYEPFYGKAPEMIPDAGPLPGAVPEFKQGEELLKEVVTEIRRHGIKPAFLELPTGREKSSMSYFVFRDLAKKESVPFLDFSKGGADDLFLPEYCFFEEGHLNDRGARLFSQGLAGKLAELAASSSPNAFVGDHRARGFPPKTMRE